MEQTPSVRATPSAVHLDDLVILHYCYRHAQDMSQIMGGFDGISKLLQPLINRGLLP